MTTTPILGTNYAHANIKRQPYEPPVRPCPFCKTKMTFVTMMQQPSGNPLVAPRQGVRYHCENCGFEAFFTLPARDIEQWLQARRHMSSARLGV